MTGRPILTSRVSGVDLVLGDAAFYFDADDFERSLDLALTQIEGLPREELQRRGAAIQQRMLTEFSWERQGKRMSDFLLEAIRRGPSRAV